MKAKDVKSSHTLSLVRCFDAIGALVAAACTANDTTIDVVCVICQHAEAGPPSRLSILARNERLPRATPRDFNRLVSGPAVARRDQLDLACSDISCTEYLRPRARTLASATCHGTVLTDPHSHSPSSPAWRPSSSGYANGPRNRRKRNLLHRLLSSDWKFMSFTTAVRLGTR